MNRIQQEASCKSCSSDILCAKCGSTTYCGCVALNIHCTDSGCRCHGSGRTVNAWRW